MRTTQRTTKSLVLPSLCWPLCRCYPCQVSLVLLMKTNFLRQNIRGTRCLTQVGIWHNADTSPFSSQSPRSFWPVTGIASSDLTRFSEYAQSICFVFSTNQISQIWQEVCQSRTSGVRPGQSSRSVSSGYENGTLQGAADATEHSTSTNVARARFPPGATRL